MRTNLFSRSYCGGAAKPASPAAADVPAAAPASGSQHALPQAPRTDAVKNAYRSPLAMLASARKSLARLGKLLPSTCLGSPTTEATQTPGKLSTPKASMLSPRPQMTQTGLDAQGPASAGTPFYLTPLRPPARHRAHLAAERTPAPMQVPPSRTEERWQQQQSPHRRNTSPPAQRQMRPTRFAEHVPVRESEKKGGEDGRRLAPSPIDTDRARQRQHTPQASPPSPVSPSVSPTSSSPNQRKRETLLDRMNKQLAPYNILKYNIDSREDPTPTADEQEDLETRQALIDQRNRVRDIQLDNMLKVLAPMEYITPPQTTSKRVSIAQYKVIDANRRAYKDVIRKELDMDLIARDYAKAQRRIESLKNSGADYNKLKRLERMMTGYQNWLALQQMVDQINDQLGALGGPQLTDSDPSTPREREEAKQQELESHQESIAQGYW
ncbi:type III secretion system effector protein XopR [Xanthomonas vasicola]|nr:type III secretion system effector protein XopR [Xanthomonas vasicola]MDO6952141.1 type III secretion system effector protein XopR [Xanthomonas vasicola]